MDIENEENVIETSNNEVIDEQNIINNDSENINEIDNDNIENEHFKLNDTETSELDSIENVRLMENDDLDQNAESIQNDKSFENDENTAMENTESTEHDNSFNNDESIKNTENFQSKESLKNDNSSWFFFDNDGSAHAENNELELVENVEPAQIEETSKLEAHQENAEFVENEGMTESDEHAELQDQNDENVEQENVETELQEDESNQETEIFQEASLAAENVVISEDVYEETEIVSELAEQNEDENVVQLQENVVQHENLHDDVVEQESSELDKEVELVQDSEVKDVENVETQQEVAIDEGLEDDYGGQVDAEEGEEVVDDNVAQHDNENEEEEEMEENVKLGHASDDDVRGSEDESNEKNEGGDKNETVIAKMFDSDSEEEEEEEKEGDLVADIFGKSDDENEEFVGFGEEEEGAPGKRGALISDSDTDEEDEPVQIVQQTTSHNEEYNERERDEDSDGGGNRMVYDFDLMLQRKKAERKGPRKRDGGTFISDADDIINAMLTKMKDAAEADRLANQNKKPALKKLKMLPTVVRHLKKQDLKEAFVDNGMVAAIADWLSLLPDRSLVHLSIRTELLKILHDLPPVSSETLKASGVGKSVMILFKHPRESRQNRESAGRLINKWSRPLFGLNENFKSMSRGEREQRDLEQMPQSKRRRLSAGQNIEEKAEETQPEPGQLRPGDRGFVLRARVPRPSHKDYVIRPKWKVDAQDEEDGASFRNKRSKPKKDERLEKHLKNFADRKKNQKLQRAVGISIEGSKMPLT